MNRHKTKPVSRIEIRWGNEYGDPPRWLVRAAGSKKWESLIECYMKWERPKREADDALLERCAFLWLKWKGLDRAPYVDVRIDRSGAA